MEMSLNKAVSILKETFSEWMEDQAPTLGAALAYYTVFSLAHLLIIAISISGLVFGNEVAQGQIFNQLRGSLGDRADAVTGPFAAALPDISINSVCPGWGNTNTQY